MGTILQFEKILMKVSPWQESASIPFISGINILQNSLINNLGDKEELNVGYGTIPTIYPYRQQNTYTRDLSEQEVEVIRLENDYLKAIFIPSLGGRLWSLYDKVAKKELLYVNDVIRPSNLAVRNAWVSGGVEWNVGIIGHTPFTCEQIFVGTFEVEGMPVLRMYEYERIRQITYQMEFYLPEDSRFLMARMKIVNPNEEEVPMYWWSNMAVPELENGRLVVNADEAFTNKKAKVTKVSVPFVDGVDISYPKRIPRTVDYFFDIPSEKRKYITQLNEDGYGMIQTSTSRLQGRKLFVWGQAEGGKRWQNYLNEKAGNYIEIQAGLGKTQYACIPMPAHEEWEWIEAYGAIQIDKQLVQGDWKLLRKEVEKTLEVLLPEENLELTLEYTRETIGNRLAQAKQCGSMFGAIENKKRELMKREKLSQYLDFGQADENNPWIRLIKEGTFGEERIEGAFSEYMMEDTYYTLLQQAVRGRDKNNAATWYHLGLNELVRYRTEEAIKCFKEAEGKDSSSLIHHGLAVAYTIISNKEEAINHSLKAIALKNDDISLLKDCIELLIKNEAYEKVVNLIGCLPESVKYNSRVKIYEAYAAAKSGQIEYAETILLEGGDFELEDLREGDNLISQVWNLIQDQKDEKTEIPFNLDFRAGI